MTVTLALDPEQEHRLRQEAQARGLDTDSLVYELVDGALERLGPVREAIPARVLGLHAGHTWVSDDFDAPLPDGFWIGAE